MPAVSNSTIVERIGVYYTGYLFSLAGVVFRENPNTDVGIDAQVELVDSDGLATGKLAGVQIKSGDSFVDLGRESFTLRAEQKHFEYWARYILPVIGVVYSPTLKKAVWFNLTAHSRRVIEEGEPYRITDIANQDNELNEQNIHGALSRIIQESYAMPASIQEVEQVAQFQEKSAEGGTEEVIEESREAAWKRLTNILLASKSEPGVLADAAYRLSWHFPGISQSQRDFFIDRISHATDEELSNVVVAMNDALSIERDDAATLIWDLLQYIPNPVERLKRLARQRVVPMGALEALFQAVECFTQDFEQDFREEIYDLYGTSYNGAL
jgi:hypothetical protein